MLGEGRCVTQCVATLAECQRKRAMMETQTEAMAAVLYAPSSSTFRVRAATRVPPTLACAHPTGTRPQVGCGGERRRAVSSVVLALVGVWERVSPSMDTAYARGTFSVLHAQSTLFLPKTVKSVSPLQPWTVESCLSPAGRTSTFRLGRWRKMQPCLLMSTRQMRCPPPSFQALPSPSSAESHSCPQRVPPSTHPAPSPFPSHLLKYPRHYPPMPSTTTIRAQSAAPQWGGRASGPRLQAGPLRRVPHWNTSARTQ
mmetsp:Transcript_2397/g.5616  ORF Transcript_2397/g.5616 Transcript_2397/m.5616 type:complete len:256 (-) Transcript_2397:123-890(-)